MAAAVSAAHSPTTTTRMPPDQHHHLRENSSNHIISGRAVLVPAESTAAAGESSVVDSIAVEEVGGNNIQIGSGETTSVSHERGDFGESHLVGYSEAAAVAENIDHYGISGEAEGSYCAAVVADATYANVEHHSENGESSIHSSFQRTASAVSLEHEYDSTRSYNRASYVRFGGYMDCQGIVHSHEADWEEEKTEENSKNLSSMQSNSHPLTPDKNIESNDDELNNSVEGILEASRDFARSHPEKRFSSSLENLYSSSKRHLYPDIDDVDIPETEPSEPSHQPEASSCGRHHQEPIVPEPPGTEDEDDVKVGVASTVHDGPAYAYASAAAENRTPMYAYASTSTDNDSPAYAVASLGDISAPATEATVLETARTPEEVLLEKLAQEDAELAAMKRAGYNGELGGYATSMSSSTRPEGSATSIPEERATVVAITEHYVHPSDISNDAVTAELIGEDYNNVSSVGASAMDNLSDTATTAHAASTTRTEAVLAVDDSLVNSEATIIDQQTNWNSSYTEEAVVLQEDTTTPYLERKPPATPTANVDEWPNSEARHLNATANTYNDVAAVAVAESEAPDEGPSHQESAEDGPRVAFADEIGEVVGVSEEFHPAEVPEDEAEAELVGEDFDCAIVLPQRSVAEAISSPPDESTGQFTELQAAMVVGYEDDGSTSRSPMATARAYSYGSPRPEPVTPAARAYSEPANYQRRTTKVEASSPTVCSTQEAVAEPNTVAESDWMRTTSFGDTSADHSVSVTQQPQDSEGIAAVPVGTLPASVPPPIVDSTSCCTVDNPPARPPMQPAIPAASLNAYENAPSREAFDETDCHAMAMMRQRASMGTSSETSSIAEPVGIPPPMSFNSPEGANEGAANGSGSVSSTTSNHRGGFQTKITSSIARGMEMLFGDTKLSSERSSFDSETAAKYVVPRTLLPWSVIHSEATDMWVATVNTNQKALESKNVIEASKSLRAFSVVTEKQATCLAKAWSPPRMHPFSKNPACHICKSKFAVFRRACHCRNCGICVCTSCVVPWPSKMVPETYNIKKESFINICKGCDWLCTSFRLALLEGDLDKTIALFSTGNVNLVTPFANVKGELFYPVHCAALGGNLAILRWLVDDNCCPIKSVRVSGRCRDSSNSFTEISTSKGRSLLGIALENRNVGIVRYLVVDKGIQLSGEKDINMDTLCRNLDLVLRLLPEEASRNTGNAITGGLHLAALAEEPSHQESPNGHETAHDMRALNDSASDGSLNDACIICFDATIDCVATPCGHQVCCMDCSKNIERCPVCAVGCSFMRVFRP